MKIKLYLIPVILIALLLSCKTEKRSEESSENSNTEKTLKNISELSYMEIYYALFTDGNGGFDAHGDLYGQDAISSVSVEEEPASCGNKMYLENTTAKSITLAVKASFNFPGNPTHEMLRAYTVKAHEKVFIGNSKLCYDGETYTIERTIVSAGFSKD